MTNKIAVIVGLLLILIVFWWVILWIANGGWPFSGPVGDELPPHIQYVMPADGERVEEASGFCVHFYFLAGNGMNEDPRKSILYYFDGINVTKRMVDAVTLEYGYPDPVGEPCYTHPGPLNSKWHTVKVRYNDNTGKKFNYTWRFEVINKH
jgi:hypothetical protein